MRVGLALPCFDFSVPGERPLHWSTVDAVARRAEELGFDSVWVADHPDGLDPIVVLAALARRTRRLRLGALGLSCSRRPITVLAKALATVDVLSGGRLVVGIGGADDPPGPSVAAPSSERPQMGPALLAETIEVLHGMWQGGPFSFEGDHARAVDAYCLPRPVQRPRPPVWVGGDDDGLLELAATRADGWHTGWTQTPEGYQERLRALTAACERADRPPASVTLSLGLYALVGEDQADVGRRYQARQGLSPGTLDGMSLGEWRPGRLVGTVEEVAEQLDGWAGLGVSTLIVNTGVVPFAMASPDDLEMIAAAASLSGDGNAFRI